jgi:hypothetical protein
MSAELAQKNEYTMMNLTYALRSDGVVSRTSLSDQADTTR